MKLWTWLPGRQADCEYMKMCLWSFKFFGFGSDCYILKYPPGSYLPWHKDPVPGKEHWRTNITVKGSSIFFIKRLSTEQFYNKDIGWFRPDLYEHSVLSAEGCTKISIGFVKPTKKKDHAVQSSTAQN